MLTVRFIKIHFFIYVQPMKTVLLIEHNWDFLENLTEIFEMEGYKVFKTNTEKSGIAFARKQIPDLIICANYKINGNRVLRLLLERTTTKTIPFIFISSKSEKTDRIKALNLGANDYIVKPFGALLILKSTKKWIQ